MNEQEAAWGGERNVGGYSLFGAGHEPIMGKICSKIEAIKKLCRGLGNACNESTLFCSLIALAAYALGSLEDVWPAMPHLLSMKPSWRELALWNESAIFCSLKISWKMCSFAKKLAKIELALKKIVPKLWPIPGLKFAKQVYGFKFWQI